MTGPRGGPATGQHPTPARPRESALLHLATGIAAAESEEAEDPGAEGPGRGTVLVIDDDPAARAITRRVLAREGYHVVEAADGEAGLALVRDLRQDPRHRGIPVVVTTAKTLTEADRTRLNGGGQRVIQKHALDAGTLLAEVRAAVGAR